MTTTTTLLEGMGDEPNWMKIHGYSTDSKKSEIILELGESGKTYWFPASPHVIRRFRTMIKESRLTGLRYLQNYINTYRGYSGWPDKKYVEDNRIADGNKSLTVTVLHMFSEGMDIGEVAKDLGLTEDLVKLVAKTYGALNEYMGSEALGKHLKGAQDFARGAEAKLRQNVDKKSKDSGQKYLQGYKSDPRKTADNKSMKDDPSVRNKLVAKRADRIKKVDKLKKGNLIQRTFGIRPKQSNKTPETSPRGIKRGSDRFSRGYNLQNNKSGGDVSKGRDQKGTHPDNARKPVTKFIPLKRQT